MNVKGFSFDNHAAPRQHAKVCRAEVIARLRLQGREGAELIKRIVRSFQSHWYDPKRGHLIYDGAHTVAEALAVLDRARGVFSEGADNDGDLRLPWHHEVER